MIRADYQVSILDPASGVTLAIIPGRSWKTLQYTRELNAVGSLALTVPRSLVSSFFDTLDLIIEVYRRNAPGTALSVEDTFLGRIVREYSDNVGDDYVTIGASSLNHFISRRILDLNDDPNAAGGYLTYQAQASQLMASLVQYQMIEPEVRTERRINGLSLGTITGGNTVYQRRQFGDSLLEILQDMEVKGEVDFVIRRDPTGLVFKFDAVRLGTDRTVTNNYPDSSYVLFAPRRGNLVSPSYSLSRTNEVNAVWVQGQGPNEYRERFLVSDGTAIAASNYNRMEGTTDSRDTGLGVIDGFETAGEAFLRDNRPEADFSATPDQYRAQGRYNVDWELGDSVTLRFNNRQVDLRISKVTIQLDGSGEDISIELQNV